ncbi:MAG: phosphopantetheine-binding protein, partial [Pseudomonadota bacterium]|nr:phosphopantetheine-binding protein [Pseudomonadota bacterium]
KDATVSCVPPANDSEQTLARIWSELLGIEEVSVTANFFQLGGHSLLATRMIAILADELRVRVPIKVVFEYPTVRRLSDWIDVSRMVAELDDAVTQAASDEFVI